MSACRLLLCTKTRLKVYAIYYASEESMDIRGFACQIVKQAK